MNRSNNNNRRVYVGNLPSNIDERDLEDIFYKYGDIADVDLKLPRYGTGGTPFAFVEFQDPRYAHKYVMYFTSFEPFEILCTISFWIAWMVGFLDFKEFGFRFHLWRWDREGFVNNVWLFNVPIFPQNESFGNSLNFFFSVKLVNWRFSPCSEKRLARM